MRIHFTYRTDGGALTYRVGRIVSFGTTRGTNIGFYLRLVEEPGSDGHNESLAEQPVKTFSLAKMRDVTTLPESATAPQQAIPTDDDDRVSEIENRVSDAEEKIEDFYTALLEFRNALKRLA